MTRVRWHILYDEDALILTRQLPVRFDVSAQTMLPDGSRRRMAHQIRQDLWRSLQNVRGFSPVVRVETQDGQLKVTAGGRVDGKFPRATLKAQIATLLADPARRVRWTSCAAHRGVPRV